MKKDGKGGTVKTGVGSCVTKSTKEMSHKSHVSPELIIIVSPLYRYGAHYLFLQRSNLQHGAATF